MIFIDFEFRNITHEFVDLVCCTTKFEDEIKEWWLYKDDKVKSDLKKYIEETSLIIVGYSTVAEARSFLSLNLDPLKFKWIDLFLEFRCLTNHNDRLNWGNQLVDGRVKFTKKPPPKWERTEEDSKTSFKHTHSLSEATYKLTGEIRDTDEKNKMRQLIISNKEFTKEDMIAIQKYCTEDVVFLKRIYEKILDEYTEVGVKIDSTLLQEMFLRGRYSALTSYMESWGYPINYEGTSNLSKSVNAALDECQREINKLFPDIKPFKFDRLANKFKWDQKRTREWLRKNVDVKTWMKTDKGDLSLSLEAFEKKYNYRHDYPKTSFPAQMIRYLKMKQSFNGFILNPKKKSLWDAVGPDKKVRPYFNIYGSQSSRSQPPATAYLLLKPAWQRSLLQPAKGKALGSFDYSSEEFLVSALWAKDKNMLNAYKSGDVYLAYGKLVGAIPKDGTKSQYKKERDLQKPIVLGMSYLMSKYGLAEHLTEITGRVWTEEEAQEKIDEFQETFSSLTEKQSEILQQYQEDGFLKLPCGWYMFGDNDNHRSICNVPIQGVSASIMRKAVDLAISRGLKVISTLHDALYIEYDSWDLKAMDILYECMREAFIYYFDDKKSASMIRLDGFTWSPDYSENEILNKGGTHNFKIKTPNGLEIDIADMYVDERAISEFNQFSKYFNDREENYL